MSSHNSGASTPQLPNSPQAGETNAKASTKSSGKRKSGKMLSVEVRFLDESVANFQIQYKATGNVLFDQACKMLNLLEVDYFGLEYADSNNTKYWLDQDKPMCRQLGLSLVNPVMYFRVKFYTPDPAHLEEEYTRYLFSLQIKQDLAQGALQCNDNTAALIASYIVQADCGDYSIDDYPDHIYLSSFKFVPHQDDELEWKIMENHKKHVGQSPSEADMNLLETARRCELYGIKMTPAKDHDGVPLNLAVAHIGILVFQHSTKITTFSWAKIRKLSFKRRKFIIKLHPEGSGFYKDAVEFFFEGRNSCKNFWKKGIENHGFFRCSEVRKMPRQRARIFSRGSSFRYSGRTQKQITEFVRENFVKRQPFQRSTSLRIPSTSRRSVENSVLGQPLLPVTSSQSCGSVALNDSGPIFTASESRPISASQPSSPRTIQEPERIVINGTVFSEAKERPAKQRDFSSGLESPDFEYDKDGLYSPDAVGHDTDDNLSHDSYHLDEHIVGRDKIGESGEKGNVEYSSEDNIDNDNFGFSSEDDIEKDVAVFNSTDNNFKSIIGYSSEDLSDADYKVGEKAVVPIISGETKIGNTSQVNGEIVYRGGDHERGTNKNGEITYILHRRHLRTEETQQKKQKIRKPRRSRLKVKREHANIYHSIPKLYSRAQQLSSSSSSSHDNSNSPRSSRNRSVDVVCINMLPAVGSFSCQDDSVDGEILGDVLKDFKNRRGSNGSPVLKGKDNTVSILEQEKVDEGSENVKKNILANKSFSKEHTKVSDSLGSDLMLYNLDSNRKLDVLAEGMKEVTSEKGFSFSVPPPINKEEDEVIFEETGYFKSSISPSTTFSSELLKEKLNAVVEEVSLNIVNETTLGEYSDDTCKDEESNKSTFSEKDTFLDELGYSLESIELPAKSPSGLEGEILSDAPTQSSESMLTIIEVSQSEFDEVAGMIDELENGTCGNGSRELSIRNDSEFESDTSSQDDENHSDTTSTGEAIQSAHSTSSEEMHQLSDSQLQETRLFLSEENLAFQEEDSESEVHYVESVSLEINHYPEELVQPYTSYTYGNYKFSRANSIGSSSVETDAHVDNTSLHEDMDILEEITERTETFSDEDETAQIADYPFSSSSLCSGGSLQAALKHRTCLKLEVSSGKISKPSESVDGGVSHMSS